MELVRARLFQAAGFHKQAQNHFARSFSITPQLLSRLMFLLEEADIEYIVAPYEADAQLAYLVSIGYAATAISEDSDLIVFGCARVVYKLNPKLQGELQVLEEAFALGALKNWTLERLRWLAVISGCDYISSLETVGPKLAYSIVTHSRSLNDVFRKLMLHQRGCTLPDNYSKRVLQALLCYRHQVVYCPLQRTNTYLQPFNQVPEELSEEEVVEAVGM